VIRVASATVILAVVLGTIWWLPWWATLPIVALAAALAGGELARLATDVAPGISPTFAGFAPAAVAVAFASQPMMGVGANAVHAVLMAGLVAAVAITLIGGPPSPAAVTRAAVLVMAPIYIGLPLGALGWVRTAAGPGPLTWFLVVIAASDTAQLYTGRLLGRRKLAPVLSPGKTVEGAAGGFVAAAVAGAGLATIWMPLHSPLACAMLGLVLAGAGIVGDLFESLLKRSAGRKDTSAIIPGHGGVLDRLDSYLLAAPIYYLYLTL
jgi:phosphatidate cytidylyltransferase